VSVVLLAFMNPKMFHLACGTPFDARWFDLALWGGVLMNARLRDRMLYQRAQKTLREMEYVYDGMLVILQDFLANQKHSETHGIPGFRCAPPRLRKRSAWTPEASKIFARRRCCLI
jgi:hypothetical protein